MKLVVGAFFVASTALAQRPAVAPVIVDHRATPLPATHLAGGRTCPVVFGTPEGGLPEGLIEVYSATRLANGNVAILDAKAKRLYVFDRTGKLITRAGGRGRGPGEFSSILPAVFPYRGDSLLVSDAMVNTIHVFDHNGKLGRTFVMQPQAAASGTFTLVGTSTIDGSTIWRHVPLRVPADGPRVYRDSITLIWRDPVGKDRVTSAVTEDVYLASSTTRKPITPPSGRSGVAFNMSMTAVAAGPVSRATGGWGGGTSGSLTARTGAVFHFEERTDAVGIYDASAALVRRILLRPLEANARPNEQRLRVVTEAQMLQLFSDERGRAWVEVARDKIDGDRKWWIFDSEGRWVADALTATGTDRILEIGSDYLLLQKKDADDVQTVAYCPIAPTTR